MSALSHLCAGLLTPISGSHPDNLPVQSASPSPLDWAYGQVLLPGLEPGGSDAAGLFFV